MNSNIIEKLSIRFFDCFKRIIQKKYCKKYCIINSKFDDCSKISVSVPAENNDITISYDLLSEMTEEKSNLFAERVYSGNLAREELYRLAKEISIETDISFEAALFKIIK